MCLSLDFSQLRMHFSSVWGIFPELAVIFQENIAFHLYNKKKKTVYAQARIKKKKKKKLTRTLLKIRGYGTNISILRDICFFDFNRSVAQAIYLFECLKLVSQYSDYSFLGKGNNFKT